MSDLFEAADKKRTNDMLKNLNFQDEGPENLIGLKNRLIEPQMPMLKGQEKEESIFHSLLTKDLGISNINDWELEAYRLAITAHNMSRMMHYNILAAFLSNEVATGLNLAKSRKGWQQDKLNELRSTYDVRGNTMQDQASKATGTQR